MAIDDISDGVDVGNVCLLLVVDLELTVFLCNESSGWKVQTLGESISSNSEEDSVEFSVLFNTSLFESDADFAIWTIWLLEFGRDTVSEEVGMSIGHILTDFIGNVLVESSEENGSNHDGSVISESGQETSTLQSDVGCTNDESFTWGLLEREDIVTGDTELFVTWDSGIIWSSTDGDDDFVRSNLLDFTLAIVKLDSVRIYKCRVRVVIFALELYQISLVSPVESLDVILNVFDHFLPVVLLGHVWGPSTKLLVLSCLSQGGGIMHHFLWDATNVYACSTEAPLGTSW